MTDRLTEQQLDAIEARANATTPGPWGTHRDLTAAYTVQARPRLTRNGTDHEGDIATLTPGRTDDESYANARFIAHAPEDVRALLAEIRRLHAELASARAAAITDVGNWLNEVGEKGAAYLVRTVDIPAAEETHVVADGSDDPEHIDDCPGCEATDTLPAWLAQRFDPRGPDWDALTGDDRSYWEHQARAVRRAVARGGFKVAEGAQR
jgi:hypothetical protein